MNLEILFSNHNYFFKNENLQNVINLKLFLQEKCLKNCNYQRIPPVWRGLTLDLEGGSGQAYAWVGPPRPDAPGLPNAALVFILTS